jgi:hypothetical protein
MNSGLEVDVLVPPAWLAALIARSAINIQRSRALVAAADTIVRAACRLRRPKLAGGSDAPDAAPPDVANPRVLRTWTRVKNGALPTDGARRRWVGPGRGERCNGCGDAITPRETEFEIDFSNALLLRFHHECLRTWESFDGRRR